MHKDAIVDVPSRIKQSKSNQQRNVWPEKYEAHAKYNAKGDDDASLRLPIQAPQIVVMKDVQKRGGMDGDPRGKFVAGEVGEGRGVFVLARGLEFGLEAFAHEDDLVAEKTRGQAFASIGQGLVQLTVERFNSGP